MRSSLRKRLDRAFDARSDTYATATTDSLVEILIDCSLNKEPLTMGELQEQSQTIFSHRVQPLHSLNSTLFPQLSMMIEKDIMLF